MTDPCQMQQADFYKELLICSDKMNVIVTLRYDFDSREEDSAGLIELEDKLMFSEGRRRTALYYYCRIAQELLLPSSPNWDFQMR
jgi:hypothetical protein